MIYMYACIYIYVVYMNTTAKRICKRNMMYERFILPFTEHLVLGTSE